MSTNDVNYTATYEIGLEKHNGAYLPPTIAVDFDGTLCDNEWPAIGEPHEEVIEWVKTQKTYGWKLILWTNRSGKSLDEAVDWCKERGIIFDAINSNLPEVIMAFGGRDSRKITADIYLDDRSKHPLDIIGKNYNQRYWAKYQKTEI